MIARPAFVEAHNTAGIISPEQYFDLCDNLVSKGFGIGKISNVTAFKLPPIRIETLDDEGHHETDAEVAVKEVYVLFDRETWPLENQLQVDAAIENMGKNWGLRTIAINRAGESLIGNVEDSLLQEKVEAEVTRLMGGFDLSEIGVYVSKEGQFREDYRQTAPGSTDYEPNPEGRRVAYDLTQDATLPVEWSPSGFFTAAGGAVLIRERKQGENEGQGHFFELAEAVRAVKAGEMSIEKALYTEDGKPKFDIWGNKPGFRQANYAEVSLNDETTALMSEMSALPNAQVSKTSPEFEKKIG